MFPKPNLRSQPVQSTEAQPQTRGLFEMNGLFDSTPEARHARAAFGVGLLTGGNDFGEAFGHGVNNYLKVKQHYGDKADKRRQRNMTVDTLVGWGVDPQTVQAAQATGQLAPLFSMVMKERHGAKAELPKTMKAADGRHRYYNPGAPNHGDLAFPDVTPVERHGVNIHVGPNGQPFSAPPSGFAYKRGPENKIIVGPDGLPSMAPIPGSPAHSKAQSAITKQQGNETLKRRSADVVTQDVNRAIGKINDSPWLTTGFGGQVLGKVGGTPAHDLENLITTVKANISFDKLNDMRQASPTGGALGNVSNIELRQLGASLGALENSQSAEELKYNLRRVQFYYLWAIHGEVAATQMVSEFEAEEQRRVQQLGGQGQQPQTGVPGSPAQPTTPGTVMNDSGLQWRLK